MLIKTPADAVWSEKLGEFDVLLYIAPQGGEQCNELSDTIYNQPSQAAYHVHTRGHETFLLESGSVEMTLYGKRCKLEPGDMVHIEPHMPHGFRFAAGTVWRELFQGLNMNGTQRDRMHLMRSSLPLSGDDDFMAEFRARHGTRRLGEPVSETVDKTALPQVSPLGHGHEVFTFPGITLRMKVGRWQTNGLKEIWEYELDEGRTLSWFDPSHDPSIFLIRRGRVRVEAGGEIFEAEPGDVIHIPPYTPFRVIVLEPRTTLLDYNCTSLLFRMLETLEVVWQSDPDRLRDKENLRRILREHGSSLTDYGTLPG